MSKRPFLHSLALLSLVLLGSLAIELLSETKLVNSQTGWTTFATFKAEAATTIYVDASATGAATGTSWTDAYTTLQDALAAAVSGDQIWVAAGVYYPDEGASQVNDDRASTFTLIDEVALYCGFAGTETSLGERDWASNVTVLSGDIDKDDTTDPNGVVNDVSNIAGNNAYHVVTGGGTDASAVMDGFIVTAGQANGSYPDNFGAGMYNDASSPTLTHVTFSGNLATSTAGGMYNNYSSPTLTNVSFMGNQATFFGGGLYNYVDSDPTLTNVIFTGNQAGNGGGMYNLIGNPTLANVIFSGNQASSNGGGIYNDSSDTTLTNVTITGNQALYGDGGGMYNTGGSNPTLKNTILWNNQAGSLGNQVLNDSSTPSIAYSTIQGSGGSGSWDTALGTDGGNNIDADPRFVTPVDPATAPTTAGDLHLQNGSPAVDTGETFGWLLTDLEGNMRPIDGDGDGSAICDMGAYEKTIDLFLPLIMR